MQRILHFALVVYFHYDIGRLSAILSRIGQASRVNQRNIRALLNDRFMGMSVHYDVRAALKGNFFQGLVAECDLIIVPMGHPHLVACDHKFFFPR